MTPNLLTTLKTKITCTKYTPSPNLKIALSSEHEDNDINEKQGKEMDRRMAANHHDPGRCMGNFASSLLFVIGTASRIRSFGPIEVHS